jgi:hypothetical protein
MKVALIGATGFVGSRMMVEALQRGHEVTAIARDLVRLPSIPQLYPASADVFDRDAIASLVAGHDAVIDTFHPGWGTLDSGARQLSGAQEIVAATKQAGIPRLLVVGSAGTLEIAPCLDLLDTGEYPSEMKATARASRALLHQLRNEEELQWTVLTPPAVMEPGLRTGSFRLDEDKLVVDENGLSTVSLEDYAVAMIDELENPQHVGQRFTIGY